MLERNLREMERLAKDRQDSLRNSKDELDEDKVPNLGIQNLNDHIKELQEELVQQKADKERIMKEMQIISFSAKQSGL